MPLKLIVCGLPAPDDVIVIAPVRVPAAVGVNVTVIVHVAFCANVAVQLFVWLKSPVAAETAIVETAPLFAVRVTACDVLVVPSVYEALGLVAFESVAAGTPVIATPQVGAMPHLIKYDTGAAWPDGAPLAPIVRQQASRRAIIASAAQRMHEDLSQHRYGQRLLEIYDNVLRKKNRQADLPCEPRIPVAAC